MISKQHINLTQHHQLFTQIGEVAQDMGTRAFVIGGYVRDLIMERKVSKDIDIVCEGSGIELAKAVSKKLPNTSLSMLPSFLDEALSST